MERPRAKIRESVNVVTKSALHVVQKMLANSRIVKKDYGGNYHLFCWGEKTVAGLKDKTIRDRLGDVVFNTLLQALGRATNVPTNTVAPGAPEFFFPGGKFQKKGTFC